MKMHYSKELKNEMQHKKPRKNKKRIEELLEGFIIMFVWLVGLSVFIMRIIL